MWGMPKINVNGVDLYYEIHGSGEPLLLLEGLGYSTWMWHRQIEYLAQHYQVIIFDNRGVGDSDKPDHPYTIEMMARDAAGLLHKLGVKKAHVLGVSMGGLIAQQLAILFPRVINKLVLCCTSHGGPNSVPMPQEIINLLNTVDESMSAERKLVLAMSPAFRPGYMEEHPEEIEEIIHWRMEKPTPRYAWLHQFMAAAAFNVEDSVGTITTPVLILSGDQDRVLPVENAYLIQKKLPHSQMKIFPGAGHMFFWERAQEFNEMVHSFLAGGMDPCM
jgi:pimeloyl-ACP methyl ester carboxylesterase